MATLLGHPLFKEEPFPGQQGPLALGEPCPPTCLHWTVPTLLGSSCAVTTPRPSLQAEVTDGSSLFSGPLSTLSPSDLQPRS